MGGRSGVSAILALLAACSSKDDGKRGAPPPHSSPSVDRRDDSAIWTNSRRKTVYTPPIRNGVWYRSGKYRMRSLVSDAAIVPIHGLPVIPHEKSENDFCSRYKDPPGVKAQSARRLGWRTDYDASFGQITFVNMFRRYEYVGAFCYQDGARLVLFDRGAPIAAIISGARARGAIGWVNKMESGALRLGNSLGDAPFGDLFLTGRDIEVRPPPPSDSICDGAATLPNVFGKPIARARAILSRSGWTADPQPPPIVTKNADGSLNIDNLDDYALYKRGFKEGNNCDPRGFCEFNYKLRKIKVMLYTHGEQVVEHFEECGDK